MKKKSKKAIEFVTGLHKFIVNHPSFRKKTAGKSETQVQTEIRPLILRYLEDYFADELTRLTGPGGLVEQGFVEVAPDRLTVIGNGRLFVRNVCMEFDRYLASKNPEKPTFSRTI